MFEDLKYDPDSGRITKDGKEIEFIFVGGKYRGLSYKSETYFSHRLAWYLYYGHWPSMQIDHINQDGLDNRISNLRDVSASTNLRNQKKIKGYHLHKKTGKWRAQYSKDNKVHHIGLYKTEQEARSAYERTVACLL